MLHILTVLAYYKINTHTHAHSLVINILWISYAVDSFLGFISTNISMVKDTPTDQKIHCGQKKIEGVYQWLADSSST